ncbi:hypothetical protein B0H13DRAFT_1912793 [Mycena leptocephala]|nr:hypothetical protein B0H13DRAFT_1912793 [Mycena leptocephala]
MAPQFPSTPTKYVVRPLAPPPGPVVLPVLLTNIIHEQYPLPRLLTDIDNSRAATPPPGPHRAPTPPQRRAPTPGPRRAPTPGPRRAPTPPQRRAPTPPQRRAPTPGPRRAPTPGPRRAPTPQRRASTASLSSRESSLTPMESDEDDSDDKNTKSSLKISRPLSPNIQTVKSLFTHRYPDLSKEDQEKKYLEFRVKSLYVLATNRVDELCARYLNPSSALKFQEPESLQKVYDKVTETFPWVVEYDKHWPVAVCLQSKLHNSAARSIEKSCRKVVRMLSQKAPSRTSSRTKKNSL